MPRNVDEKKTRKALRKLRKAKQRAEAEGVELTDWEQEFVDGVDERLTKYGSAFADPSLGGREEALSSAQTEILRQLDRKSRGKSSGGFKTRKPLKARKGFGQRRYHRDDARNDEDEAPPEPPEQPMDKPKLVTRTPDISEPVPDISRSSRQTPVFRIIQGGKSDQSEGD